VVQHFKNLQLTIFVPLVLKHLLDSHSFTGFGDSSFEDNTKRSISDDLLSIVGERLLLQKDECVNLNSELKNLPNLNIPIKSSKRSDFELGVFFRTYLAVFVRNNGSNRFLSS
jgi:hypothetical protein